MIWENLEEYMDRQLEQNKKNDYFKEKDCKNCIWHDTSCTQFHCRQITRQQINAVLNIIDLCETTVGNSSEDTFKVYMAKVIAFEHIADELKGGHR